VKYKTLLFVFFFVSYAINFGHSNNLDELTIIFYNLLRFIMGIVYDEYDL